MGVFHGAKSIPSATALLGLSFAAGCGGDGGGGSGNNSIIGEWQLYQIIDEDGQIYSFPLVYEDLNYGCTVTQGVGLEIISTTEGTYTSYNEIAGCDDPANNTTYDYAEPVTIEPGGSGYLIMAEGDVLDCALTSELSCVDIQGNEYSYRRT